MSINIDVQSDLKEVRTMFRELGPGVDKAAARALNDTITTVRAQGARAIKLKHKALKIGDIKREMKLGRATQRLLSAHTSTEGKPLPLRLFRPGVKRAGVTAIIGNSRVLMGGPGRRAFVIAAYGNEYFIRKHAKGRRVRRIRGPSLPGVFRASLDKFTGIAHARWAIAFPNRLRYEIDNAVKKARGAR